jgi:dipeptidyl aminopeptidase/acylaminoacyl peptidase
MPVSVEDIVSARYFADFSPVRFSPDGKWLAYVVIDNRRRRSVSQDTWGRTGVAPWGSGADIYVLNIATGATTNLTLGQYDNWLPSWSPDSKRLIFFSDRDGSGKAKLWVWDVSSNTLKKITETLVLGQQIEWTHASQQVIVTAVPESPFLQDLVARGVSPPETGTESGKATAGPAVVIYKSPTVSSSDSAFPSSDPWNLNTSVRTLLLVDVASGRTKVVVHDQRISTFRLSPDDRHIAYTQPERFEQPGSQQILFDLIVASLTTTTQRKVASNIRLGYDGAQFSWSPDATRLGYRSKGKEDAEYDWFAVDIDGNAPQSVTAFHSSGPSPLHTSGTPLWDENQNIYFIRAGTLWRGSLGLNKPVPIATISDHEITRLISPNGERLWMPDGSNTTIVASYDRVHKQDGFYRIDLATGATAKLIERAECYTCANLDDSDFAAVMPDGEHLAYFREDAQHSAELWLDSVTFESPRQLTHLNPCLERYKMGSVQLIDWLSDDGVPLHGALLFPPDYRPGSLYPMVVDVYGGVFSSDDIDHFGLTFGGFNLQLLATRGYVVLKPDAPQQFDTPMPDLAKTVLPGVNKVITMGVADPDRLGLMGISYGGYSTVALLAETRRFKAAIEVAGYADLIGAYGAMDRNGTAYLASVLEKGQGRMGATPWQAWGKYTENSPVRHFDNIRTPLLMIHGSQDQAVASFLADQIFVGLRRLGQTVEYAKYTAEGHSPTDWSYADQIDSYQRMIAWFDKYLKDQHLAAASRLFR